MKYTFINRNGKEQTIDIPEDFIVRNKRALRISTQEACELYLSDEGYIDNEVVQEINEIVNAGKTRRGPKRKEDPIKRSIIAELEKDLQGVDYFSGDAECNQPQNITIMNPERIIRFELGDDTYEITLSRKRKPKA